MRERFFLLFFGFVGLVYAGESLIARPVNRVEDDARLFLPEQMQEMKDLVAEAESHGFEFFGIFRTYFTGDEHDSLKLNGMKLWIGEAPGAALIYSRADVAPYWIISNKLREQLPTKVVTELFLGPNSRLVAARKAADDKSVAVVQGKDIVAEMRFVVKGLILEVQRESVAGSLGLSAWFVLSIAGLSALVALWWGTSDKESRVQKSGNTAYFPPVRVGYRLGAPFGGGVVSRKDS